MTDSVSPSRLRAKALSSFGVILLGNFLYALTVKLFLLPCDMVTGGTTGIALGIQHFTGLSVPAFVLLFNIVMLLTGYKILGRQFALTTVVSSFAYPLALNFLDGALGGFILTDDLLLCTIFSGLGIGLALSVVIRAGASTGGMDIPPLALYKLWRVPVSASLYVFDCLILLFQAVYNPPEKILYGILLILIYTLVLDKLLCFGTSKTGLLIISSAADAIRRAILSEGDRGVTIIKGQGGYLETDISIILTYITNRELPKIERLVKSIDPECFMVVSSASEISGRGFSLSKQYGSRE